MSTNFSATNLNTWQYLGFNYASKENGKFAELESTNALAYLKEVGADTATIVNTHFVQNTYSSEIFSTLETESLENFEKAIVDAKDQGLAVWIKPHINIQSGEFRGLLNPANRLTFFENYKALMLDYAQIAQEHSAEVFVIGTELDSLVVDLNEAEWLDIISAVKDVYDGQITYAATWDKSAVIPFSSELDFVGIDAYFPLTENTDATVDELVNAWTQTPENDYLRQITGGSSIVDWLKDLSDDYGKPIVFAEVGYRSADGTAAAPYAWWGDETIDFTEQTRLYEAFFKVFSGEALPMEDLSWFEGAQLWSWYTYNTAIYSPTMVDSDYPLAGKPAEVVFRNYAPILLAEENLEPPSISPPVTEIDVNFEMTSDWSTGFTGDFLITNTGNVGIENWVIEFESDANITDSWNAEIISLGNNRYQATAIASSPWNDFISPGEEISFGFLGNAENFTEPTLLSMVSDGEVIYAPEMSEPEPEPEPPTLPPSPIPEETNLLPSEDINIEFEITHDWDTGFTGDFLITNLGQQDAKNWTMTFEAPYEITDSWNATFLDLGNNQYQATAITSSPWNEVISPGETISFGFLGIAPEPTVPSVLSWNSDITAINDSAVAADVNNTTNSITANDENVANSINSLGTSSPSDTPQAGVEDDLNGCYFTDCNLDSQSFNHADAITNFNENRQEHNNGLDPYHSSVRWSGYLIPEFTENYRFSTKSDNNVRLWVEDQLLIDDWSKHLSAQNTGRIDLEAERLYPITLEYFEHQGTVTSQLLWSSLSQELEVIPQEHLSMAEQNASAGL